MALPQGTVALVGRTLLVLAGAYVARALTDGRVVPAGVGVALGLAYAVFWQLRADREARAGRRESAVFHALASSLIAFPLALGDDRALRAARAEGGVRRPRRLLRGSASAWRGARASTLGAWVTTGLTLATAVALLVAHARPPRGLRRASRDRRRARVARLSRAVAAPALGGGPRPRRRGVPARRPRGAAAGAARRLRPARSAGRGGGAARAARALRG